MSNVMECAGRDDRALMQMLRSMPVALLVVCLVAGCLSSTARAADFGIAAFDLQVAANQQGDASFQAGAHPYAVSTQLEFNQTTHPLYGTAWPVEATRDVVVDLPPGLIGNPVGIKQCTLEQLAYTVAPPDVLGPLCPPESQIGIATVRVNFQGTSGLLGPTGVFEMVPPPNVPARFGFNVANTVVTLDAELRTGGDYGLSVNASGVPEGLAILGTDVTFWGEPASAAHDGERYCPGAAGDSPGCASTAAVTPFLRNPTSCSAPGAGLLSVARMDSWVHPGVFTSATVTSHLPPGYPLTPDQWGAVQGTEGCDQVPFAAGFDARPAESPPAVAGKVGTPSGYAFDLTMPQEDDPDSGLAPSDLKKAVVTLPKGVRVSPSAADGLQACSPAQVALTSSADPTCPDASKVGTLTITTPLLEEQMTGFVYLAKPHDNPSNTLLALYLVAKGPGVMVKLPGRVDSDPDTGQLTATFDNNPQLPFSHLHLDFNDGPRAQLVNPSKCGTYTTHATLTGWSGKTVTSTSSFDISRDGAGAPCPEPRFKPQFAAGVARPTAAGRSPFLLTVSREDADQEIEGLSIHMPAGVTARVAGVPLCSSARAAAGTCEAESLIGTVTTAAGPGPNPFYITNGRVYLTEAYKNGKFGLSIVVPAVAGPFDLGNVVVRAAIVVDPETTELDVVSDPVPTSLQGIQLQVRLIHVEIDRSKFIINPTSCTQKQVRGTITSTEGMTENVSYPFAVANCGDLVLKPRMQLKVGSKGHTRPRTSTPLTATLTQSPGQSNLKAVKVTLPLALNALLPVVTKACTLDEFHAGDCEKARAGTATAITPLLAKPLTGGVYFVKNGPGLPDLVVALRGQVDVNLTGHVVITQRTQQLSTNFNTIPDVPIRKFVLKLQSGKNGPLGVVANLCSKAAKRSRASIGFRGQNGDVINTSQRLQIAGCPRSGTRKSR